MTGFEERLIRTGRAEGRVSLLVELVNTGMLTIQQASEIAGIDVQQLEVILEKE